MEEQVILVDTSDRPVGVAEKLQAHQEGILHRAFSIFVLNGRGELMLQQRAHHKYHSGGLWTNTCCSHPRPGEATAGAAQRRLQEEMGFACPLDEIFQFVYRAELDNDLIEHEFDRVFLGYYDGEPHPNPSEVAAWKWIPVSDLQEDISAHPEVYTYWLRNCFAKFMEHVGLSNSGVTL